MRLLACCLSERHASFARCSFMEAQPTTNIAPSINPGHFVLSRNLKAPLKLNQILVSHGWPLPLMCVVRPSLGYLGRTSHNVDQLKGYVVLPGDVPQPVTPGPIIVHSIEDGGLPSRQEGSNSMVSLDEYLSPLLGFKAVFGKTPELTSNPVDIDMDNAKPVHHCPRNGGLSRKRETAQCEQGRCHHVSHTRQSTDQAKQEQANGPHQLRGG